MGLKIPGDIAQTKKMKLTIFGRFQLEVGSHISVQTVRTGLSGHLLLHLLIATTVAVVVVVLINDNATSYGASVCFLVTVIRQVRSRYLRVTGEG